MEDVKQNIYGLSCGSTSNIFSKLFNRGNLLIYPGIFVQSKNCGARETAIIG
jgi:hypothetical protein